MDNARPAGRILVIEDDPDARANLRAILELDHHAVDTAGSIREAWSDPALRRSRSSFWIGGCLTAMPSVSCRCFAPGTRVGRGDRHGGSRTSRELSRPCARAPRITSSSRLTRTRSASGPSG